jgi:hypothetical protein
MDSVEIALGAVGVLAGGGVLLLAFAPALLTLVVDRIEKTVVALVRTRVGCAAIAGAVCWFAADMYRSQAAEAACDARVAQNAAAAETARLARDVEISADIEKRYGTIVAGLKKTSDDLQKKASNYERSILALRSAAASATPAGKPGKPVVVPAGGCQLGADALQLRRPRR